jgi:predicted GNAT family acetyltransferase
MSAGTHGTTGEDLPIRHAAHAGGGAFFVEVDGARLAELTYARPSPGHAVIEHTVVSERLGGRGVGRRLVLAAVEWARADGTKLAARCSFARAMFGKDAAIRDVLERGA